MSHYMALRVKFMQRTVNPRNTMIIVFDRLCQHLFKLSHVGVGFVLYLFMTS